MYYYTTVSNIIDKYLSNKLQTWTSDCKYSVSSFGLNTCTHALRHVQQSSMAWSITPIVPLLQINQTLSQILHLLHFCLVD